MEDIVVKPCRISGKSLQLLTVISFALMLVPDWVYGQLWQKMEAKQSLGLKTQKQNQVADS